LTGFLRRRRNSWAAWLALAALALNALLPIHLALDLGEVCRPAGRAAPETRGTGLEWRLIALATGHDAGDGKPDADDHRPACPAFGAIGAFGGYAGVAAPALPIPTTTMAPPLFAAIAAAPSRAPTAAYRSRAPPLG
jgi:hypothetical protein